MRVFRSLPVVVFASLVCLPGLAQVAPKPGPELAKLAFLAGSWTTEGELKPGPMGPGGKVNSTDEGKWMEGNFFLIMHSKFTGASGDLMSYSVYGYDPRQKHYTYDSYNTMGEAGHYIGALEGNTWTWTSDGNFGGQTFKAKFTLVQQSDTAYTYKYEISPDGTKWILVMDGKGTKK